MTDIIDTLIPGLENYLFITILGLAFYGLTLYLIKSLYDFRNYISLEDSVYELREYGIVSFILSGKIPLIMLDLILYIGLLYFLRDTYLLAFLEWYPIDLLQFIIYATLGLILLPIAGVVIALFSIVFNPSS